MAIVEMQRYCRSLAKKGKARKRFCLKVMKARRPVPFGIRVPSMEACSLLLEKYVLLEYVEELL